MILLAIYAFPLELVAVAIGMVWCVRSSLRHVHRFYLGVTILTFLLFAFTLGWKLPVRSAGPVRVLLPFLALLLPYAGMLLARLIWSHPWPRMALLGLAMLLIMTSFNVNRAFNYPARRHDRAEFYIGHLLKGMQTLGTLPAEGKILVEEGPTGLMPFPMLVMLNAPERFALLRDVKGRDACREGLGAPTCLSLIREDGFELVALSSPTAIQHFLQVFPEHGDTWEVGRYRLFRLSGFRPVTPKS